MKHTNGHVHIFFSCIISSHSHTPGYKNVCCVCVHIIYHPGCQDILTQNIYWVLLAALFVLNWITHNSLSFCLLSIGIWQLIAGASNGYRGMMLKCEMFWIFHDMTHFKGYDLMRVTWTLLNTHLRIKYLIPI